MARSCWRCAELIEDTASRCTSCGARIIPIEEKPLKPEARARKFRLIGLVALVAFAALVFMLLSEG